MLPGWEFGHRLGVFSPPAPTCLKVTSWWMLSDSMTVKHFAHRTNNISIFANVMSSNWETDNLAFRYIIFTVIKLIAFKTNALN